MKVNSLSQKYSSLTKEMSIGTIPILHKIKQYIDTYLCNIVYFQIKRKLIIMKVGMTNEDA